MRLMGRPGSGILVGVALVLFLAGFPAEALDVPPLTGRVVDVARVLPSAVVEQLSTDLQAHETKTSNQVAVLIVTSLEGEPLFDFSHRVATAWKLGQKGTDNGALLFVAIRERKIRLEVGYGLEGVLTDARSAQIIRNEIVPRFRSGDIPAGITAGVRAILTSIEGTYNASETPAAASSFDEAFGNTAVAVIVGVVIGLFLSRANRLLGPVIGGGLSFLAAPWLVPALIAGTLSLVLVSLFSAMGSGRGRNGSALDGIWFSRQNGGWGSGGFGGPFGRSDSFSGGGGGFGGGGASGDW